MLKVHLELLEDPQHDSNDIGLHFTQLDWLHWFESYREMITQYIKLAEDNKVPMVSIGSNLATACILPHPREIHSSTD